MNNKKYIYTGIFFLILQILIIWRNVWLDDYLSFLWLCDFLPILFAISFFFKKVQFTKGLINLCLIPQLVYFIDLIIYTFSKGAYTLGFIPTVISGPMIFFLISVFAHLLSTSVAFILTYREKTEKISLAYSLVLLMIIFCLTLYFSPAQRNVNCVFFFHGIIFNFYGIYYTLLWPILVFLFIIFPTYFTQKTVGKN